MEKKNLLNWVSAFALSLMLSGFGGVCNASPDSNMLAVEQKSAEIVAAGLLGASPSSLAAQNVARVFTEERSKAFTAEVYRGLRSNCVERFGKMLDNKFASYQRLEKEDIVVYVGSFEKEKVVLQVFTFDKSGKLLSFEFNPPAPQKGGKKKKK